MSQALDSTRSLRSQQQAVWVYHSDDYRIHHDQGGIQPNILVLTQRCADLNYQFFNNCFDYKWVLENFCDEAKLPLKANAIL